MLRVDRGARTIEGRAIPWGIAAVLNRQRIALEKNALSWSGEPVHLLLRHNHSLIVGKVVLLEPVEDGLWALLRVASGARGDKALAVAEAGWGFSLGFTTITAELHDGIEWITHGEIDEISLVPKPAFP